MVTINVKNDFIDDVQMIVDVCDGEGRSIECRSLVILAKKLLGAIKQTDGSEFTVELIEVDVETGKVVEGDESNETIQSTESVDEHIEKSGETIIEKLTGRKRKSSKNKNK